MNTEIEQRPSDRKMQERHKKSDAHSVEIYRPRRWQSNLVFAVAGAVGIGGFGWLLWASAAYAEIANPINFITTGCLALFLIVVAIAQFGLYWSQRDLMSAQWNTMERGLERTDAMLEKMQGQLEGIERQADTMDRSLVISTRAYIEVHSIESNVDTGETFVTIENIGKIPAGGIEVEWEIYSFKDGQTYKPKRTCFDYDRLAPGNFKICFDFNFMQFFAPEECMVIAREGGVKFPVFLDFQITYHDGFGPQTTKSSYGFVAMPKNKWMPMHKIRKIASNPKGNSPNTDNQNSENPN
jgi:hypothetical protein